MRIFEENFIEADPKLLLDPKSYQDVEDMVVSIDAAATPDYAKQFVLPMSDKLAEVGDRMPPDLLRKYTRLFKVLLLLSMPSMKDKEKERFFRENISETFYADYTDVKRNVELSFLSYLDDPQIIEQLRQTFLQGFEKNQEILGTADIAVTVSGENKQVKPMVQNWLLDYNSSVHVDAANHQRDSFGQTSYMLHSPNVQKLSKEDREALLKLIQFYDWLKFDPLRYDFRLPGQPVWQIKEINANTPQKLISDEALELISSLRSKNSVQTTSPAPYMTASRMTLPQIPQVGQTQTNTAPAPIKPLPPVVPTPANKSMTQKVGMGEITQNQKERPAPMGQQAQDRAAKVSELLAKSQSAAPKPNVSAVLPDYKKPVPPAIMNAQALAEQMEKKRRQEESEIDQKLQNLEQRVKNKNQP